ncbi:hypothetical protein [Alicyclobacillus dauci]|uniref:Uncharacterized protein n=1 Tax=Alicyclobacillus dauci TaxID=1475485 RepID=A0ABY6Z9J3_9BACL|nr:hypothetical protein [Alicyclobacillus dauci]WAH39511.1 hypothetical protein NZD86_24400 [Alicyclobacillus dauci]WAH39571.1 hypothetical protein NZD86_24100 [Alicyclobacillus dauci]
MNIRYFIINEATGERLPMDEAPEEWRIGFGQQVFQTFWDAFVNKLPEVGARIALEYEEIDRIYGQFKIFDVIPVVFATVKRSKKRGPGRPLRYFDEEGNDWFVVTLA